jgi:hypothetical protein
MPIADELDIEMRIVCVVACVAILAHRKSQLMRFVQTVAGSA